MLKKIFIILSSVVIILLLTLLFTPFHLFQNTLIDIVNKKELGVKLRASKPISYRLLSANELLVEDLQLKVDGFEIDIEKIDLEIDPNSIFEDHLKFRKFDLIVKSLKEVDSQKEGKKKELKKSAQTQKVKDEKNSQGRWQKVTLSNAKISVHEILLKKYKLNEISISSKEVEVSLKDLLVSGELSVSALTKSIVGEVNLTKKTNQSVKATLDVKKLEEVLKIFKLENVNIYGDLRVDFTSSINKSNDFLKNPMSLAVNGKKLKWIGKDLDKILEAYIDSKKVGILDAAGFLTLGPIGILVAKGADLGNTGIRGIVKGETHIREVHVAVNLKDEVVKLEDVALATKEHKVALQGSIDLSKKVFEKFSIASVDEKGCSIFVQKISGSLSDPEIGAVGSFMNEVFSPVTDIFNKGLSLVTDNCDGYYKGIVK
ncbi:hypothetical protein BIY24_04055 [Halobacteriovorax marinus]|uniref:hypothetical protein n=1 Tax=Halobacteriovorax marinus TaxID=97084 RepID=UPI000BC32946|nr:hypothetical protein [Halobacteriovorax marinus]ATH07138.1 hypothetical protein BIY24_04055 [Halobacteriovorax marinus]